MSTQEHKTFWPLMKDYITAEDKTAMIEFIQNAGRFTNGPMVKKFEQEWSKWLGVKHSLFVSSGSTANLLLVAAVKEKYNLIYLNQHYKLHLSFYLHFQYQI